MLKKILLILSIFFVISLFSCGTKETEVEIDKDIAEKVVQTETSGQLEEEGKKPLTVVSPEDTLQILVREDGAPGMYLGEDGEVHGFYVDLTKIVMEEMNQSYNFVPFNDVGPAAHGLKSGTFHIALAVPDVPDYRAFLNLSIPFEVLHYVIFVQNNDSEIFGNTKEALLKSLHGKRVGVQSQGQIHQVLRDIKEIEIVEYPTTTKALGDLNKGLLDAVPDVKRIGNYYSEKNNWEIKAVGVPIISHKDTTGFSQMFEKSLLDRYNKALKSIISDGRFAQLYADYFGPMDEEDKP